MSESQRRRTNSRTVLLDRSFELLPVFRLSDSADESSIAYTPDAGGRWRVLPSPGDLPPGVYRAEITGGQSAAISGKPEDFGVAVFNWTISGGHWHVNFSFDGDTPEETSDVYAAVGDEVTFRIALDNKIPRTPGVNRFTWSMDPDGTLHLLQIDDELRDVWFAVPWIRVGDAPDARL